LQTALQNLFGDRVAMTSALGDPGARNILEKLLGQEGIAATEKEMKEGGAGSLRGGAQMMNLAMNKLNASPEMAREAIEQITKYTMGQAQFEKQKWGPDYARYRSAGKDITDFDRWYDSKYNISDVVPPVQVQGTMPPPAALSKLQEGQHTTFGNGQVWTMQNGKPVQVK
jgi:hypothetical protein